MALDQETVQRIDVTLERIALLSQVSAAELAGDSETLSSIWLELQGLEWVDSIDELAADTTPVNVAAARIRELIFAQSEE